MTHELPFKSKHNSISCTSIWGLSLIQTDTGKPWSHAGVHVLEAQKLRDRMMSQSSPLAINPNCESLFTCC